MRKGSIYTEDLKSNINLDGYDCISEHVSQTDDESESNFLTKLDKKIFEAIVNNPMTYTWANRDIFNQIIY